MEPVKETESSDKKTSNQRAVKKWYILKIVVLCAVILSVWILFSLPTITYHLPQKVRVQYIRSSNEYWGPGSKSY